MLIGHPMMVQLTRSEFAAVRAYVQGMPPAMVVPRYLDSDVDDDDTPAESALRILLGLRDRMVQLAHLHGRAELAVLLEMGPGRSNRGMDRRVDAVAELERLGTAMPRADHGVELWFAPALARRLRAAGIDSLDALAQAINRKGLGWWRAVPRVGALAAGTINRWLLGHRDALKGGSGLPLLHAHIGATERQRVATLGPRLAQPVPLEWLAVTAQPIAPVHALDDADRFASDLAAVRLWLDRFPIGSPTWRAYRKEAERLLLWCAIERRRPIASLTDVDGEAYLRFLRDPSPAARWIGPRASRQSMAWRPFATQLSPNSIHHALRVLSALQEWLLSIKHITVRIWRLPPTAGIKPRVAGAGPSPASMEAFLSWMQQRGTLPDEVRLRAGEAALLLGHERRLRFDGLCRITADAVSAEGESDSLTERTHAALQRHWQDRGLQWGDASLRHVALIGPVMQPPTGRAQRKVQAAPESGYSLRGLHALISGAIDRYRSECDGEFSVRSPRELLNGLNGLN